MTFNLKNNTTVLAKVFFRSLGVTELFRPVSPIFSTNQIIPMFIFDTEILFRPNKTFLKQTLDMNELYFVQTKNEKSFIR